MDPQLEAEIQKIIEDAQPLLLDISQRLLALVAEKYTGIPSPVANEIVRAMLHGLITGLEFEMSQEKENTTNASST